MTRGKDESNNPKRRPKKRWDPFLQAWTSPPEGYDYAFDENGVPKDYKSSEGTYDDMPDTWDPNGEDGPKGYEKD